MDPRRFVFISSNAAWGGSEELWSAAAAVLAAEGHAVKVYKGGIDEAEPRIRRLRELSCTIRDLKRLPLLPRKFFSLLSLASYSTSFAWQLVRLWLGLAFSRRPDLVVVSQGGNHDGLYLADVCRRAGMPYVLIMQKASDLYWPTDFRRERMRAMYNAALATFFVSQHNLELTEQQLGFHLPHASVVRNPFLVPWEPRGDWPDQRDGVRLACVGRLYPMEKGQDLLLRVLGRDKWRDRPLSVTFYGSGDQREGLEAMARHAGLTSVTFGGFVRDVAAIWNDHHGLILPSRCEGLPLVLVEAMLSGRVSIVTNIAGAEVIEDGVTGFLAAAPTEDSLDDALERAWSRREEWRSIGESAAREIRTLVPADPAAVMATELLRNAGVPPAGPQASRLRL
jgi:glycosyltransferase involved in cell wall biosynthesis